MNPFTLTDLFFWITGIAVIFLTALLAVALIYIILFLRTIRRAIKTAQRAGELISEEVTELRTSISEGKFNFLSIIKFLLGLKAKSQTGTRKKK